MTENDMLDLLTHAEKEVVEAKNNLTKAQRAVTDAESKVIEAKINRDRAKEALRVFRNRSPKQVMERRELEIEKFRTDHPELVEWARKRDANK